MRISLFGTVGVAVDERDPVVELPHRPCIVLAVLATNYGRTVADDALIDAIWGATPPSTARQALQGYVVAVRNALEPGRSSGTAGEFVVRDASGYRLIVHPDQLDLAEFDAIVASLRDSVDEESLDRAIELSDHPLAGDHTSADWAASARATVAEQRRAALNERFDLELELDTGASLLPRMRRALGEFPYDERLAGSLMTALYRSGRQAEALEVFDSLRRRLRDELGVTPGERLAALHLDVLNQASSLDVIEPSLGGVIRQVGEPGGVIGRERDVGRVVDVLLASRTVTLVGPGGAGKTTILDVVVRELAEKFPDPIRIDAALAGDGALFDAVAQAIGADRHPLLTPAEALEQAIAGRACLMVIDTCEANSTDVRELAELLRVHPSVFVLLASREPVRHRGEHVHRIAGLGEADALALLSKLVGGGADTDQQKFDELARRVDRLPLALEMIAPRIAALGAALVLAEVDRAFPVVADSSGEVPTRHRSIDALVHWSLDRLEPAEMQLLVRCTALQGGFPAEALGELPPLPDVPNEQLASVLAALVDASLVSRLGDDPATFDVFGTVGDVVRRASASAIADEQERLDSHIVTAAWADYTGASDEPVTPWVADRFATALDRLLVNPDHRAVMLATAAARRWLDLGSLAQGVTALQRALDAVPEIAPPLESIGRTILGFNQLYQGDVQGAIDSYRRAALHADSVPADGFIELVSASLAWLECDFERSWEIAASAIEQMTSPSRRAPANLVGFAKSAVFAGDLDGAAKCYAVALELSRAAGDGVAEANAMRLAAVVDALQGRHDSALASALRAAALHDSVASTLGAAQSASTVALVAALSGDLPTAATWAARAIVHARRQFDVQTVSVVLPVVATLDVAAGRLDRAAHLIGWLDHYVDEQAHVRHPTAAPLFVDLDAAFDTLNATDRRRWQAEGAAMSAAEMLELAAQ